MDCESCLKVLGNTTTDPFAGTYRLGIGYRCEKILDIILLHLKIITKVLYVSGFWKWTQGAWNLVAPTSSWVLLLEMFTASSLGFMKSNFLMSAPFNQVKSDDVRVDVNNQISMKLDQLMSSGNVAVSISLKLLFRYESQIHH